MREILRPALVLLAICAGVTLVLALVYQGTKPLIAERAAADLAAAKTEVLPSADRFDPLPLPPGAASDEALKTVRSAYRGSAAGSWVGTVVVALSRGYDAAGVALMIGVAADGRVTGIHVGDNKETPGLGTKVLDPSGPYLAQYRALPPGGPLAFGPGLDAVTGATISSRAVLRAVQGARDLTQRLNAQGVLP